MTGNKQRDALKSKSEKLKKALSSNIDDIKSHSKEISVAALIGGGILLGGYILYKLLSTKNDYVEDCSTQKIVVVKAREESIIMRSIKQSIATFLLAIARQKILEYIEKNNSENQKDE